MRYLIRVRDEGALMHFVLFDGSTVDGIVCGFGPYNVTVREADGSETTLSKLAIVSYRALPSGLSVAGMSEAGVGQEAAQ